MANPDIRKEIQSALAQVPGGDFEVVVRDLLAVLGYRSERTLPAQTGDAANFVTQFPAWNGNTKAEQEFCEDSESVRLIFQFTGTEIASSGQQMLRFESDSFDKGQQQSFIFFAVELKERTYARGKYAQFTREINKRLNQPAVVLFKTADHRLTLAFVHRREHKRDNKRDVLGHVSLVREITPDDPHRAHLDILAELSISECTKWMDAHHKPYNFDGLLAAWLDKLNTEELNRRFYQDLFDWFGRAVDKASFPTDQVRVLPAEEHVIRLITRLLFVWFMKEKGLVANNLFTEERVAILLKNYDRDTGDSYYRAVLQNLFFATLNTEMDKRDFSKGRNDTHRAFSLYRYKQEMSNPDELLGLFSQTPFINGGLFDCLDSEEATSSGGYRIDCFSDNVADPRRREYQILSIPNHLFFGESGLITLFNHYKFTVEENTPTEWEVALDPELLGKVFENLLASYNPETRETVRKQTGSYYTPRDVVDYMVEEALVTTLVEKAKPADGDAEFWQERLHYLLDYADPCEDANDLFVEEEAEGIVQAVSKIKVLDPAVGSGAFPMGILHKLTMALRRIDPGNQRWEALQKERATKKAGEAFDIRNREERDDELDEISKTFERYSGDFGRKLYLIQNSIFGVDIQPVACQIAKLRFFISLTIEQEADKNEPNFGIKPLPNLETRFVPANTLLKLQTVDQMDIFLQPIEVLKKKLEENRERHFHAPSRREKLACREEDRRLREELAEKLSSIGLPSDDATKIAQWDPYDQNSKADWFDADYMFGIAGGFDLVIGNPPYIQLQKNGGELGKLYKDVGYETFAKTGDIYQLFYERSCQLLKPQHGLLCFITSNKWMRANYGKKLRAFLSEKTNPLKLLDFGGFQVFENATVDTNVLLTQKAKPIGNLMATSFKDDFLKGNLIGDYAQNNAVPTRVSADTWFIGSRDETALKEKIERVGTPLKEWDIAIYYGIKTGYNPAFIIDKATKDALVAEDPNSADILKPILRGRDIKRYQAEWAGLWLIATLPSLHIDIGNYPAVKRHLLSYGKDRLEQTGKTLADGSKSRKKTPHQWFELQDTCAYHAEFERDKIVWGNLSTVPRFSYDRQGIFCSAPTNLLTGRNLKYILGFLNSHFGCYQMRQIAYSRRGDFMEYKKIFVEQISVPKIPATAQQPFIQVVDKIFAAKAKDPVADTTELENQIDQLIHQLYELTVDQIKVIDSVNQIR